MSNLTLNTLTYVGNGIQNGIASWINRTAGLFAGFKTVSVQQSANDKIRIGWKVALPQLVAADSPCGCAGQVKYIDHADITIRIDRKTSAAERAAILATVRDLVASTQFGESITDLITPV